jgi:hypothetical protein
MTQYLLAVHHADEFPLPPGQMQQSCDDVEAFNARLTDAGALVFVGALLPAESATVVRQAGNDVLITDGPYPETKEHLGGFWVISAADLDAALEWARLATVACMMPVEVRPFDQRDMDAVMEACREAWAPGVR